MTLREKIVCYYSLLLWPFCFTAFILFFLQPINLVLNKFLVRPVISQFENNVFNNLVLLILSLVIGIGLWIFGDKRFLRALAGSALFFYVLQLTGKFWQFQRSVIFPEVRIWDLIIASLVLPIISAFSISKKEDAKDAEQNKKAGFVEELPIEKLEHDSFNRRGLAQEIANKINLTTNEKAFAIGILGEYGSGKTSFANLIKLYLEESSTAIVDFNPWRAESTPNIQKDFFDLMASELYNLDPKISASILNYSRKLSRIDSSISNSIRQAWMLSSIFTRRNYIDDFDHINDLLTESKKKIVVFIDDVDRLYSSEVLEVLKLIRTTANFSNVFYLVAYDRNYVQESIRALNQNVASSYLDKIFQLEIPLPKREEDDLLILLEELLGYFIGEADMQSLQTHIIKHGFKNQFDIEYRSIFRQSRDVIKFINSFKITYQLLSSEVLFDNLFVLELFKFRFPMIYDRLFEYRNDFVTSMPSRSAHEEFYELRTFKEGEVTRLHITKYLQTQNYDEQDIKLISGLLNNLFFKFARSLKAKTSIIYPQVFERYFRYRLSGKDLSEKKFELAFNAGSEPMKNFIDDCNEQKLLPQLKNRLFQEKPQNKEGYEWKITSLFYLGSQYIKENGTTSFDFNDLIDELWNFDDRFVKQYYSNDSEAYASFIKDLFENASLPYLFENEIIYNVKRSIREIVITKDHLTDFQVKYFKNHVETLGLTKEAMWLAWWTRYEGENPAPGQPGYVIKYWKFEDKIRPVLIESITNNNPYEFLKLSIEHDSRYDSASKIYIQILKLFEEPAYLRKLIEDNSFLNTEVKTDYLAFYDACEIAGFDKWATYPFKTSLQPKRNDYDEF